MAHNEDDLQKMVRHIHYEWNQLGRMADRLRSRKSDRDAGRVDDADWFAWVESFALHIRNLIEFFTLDPGNSYVRVADYGSTKAPRETRLYEQACEQITHISIERARTPDEGFDWVIDDCVAKMNDKLRAFKAAIDLKWSTAFSGLAELPITRPQVLTHATTATYTVASLDDRRLKMTAKTSP